MISNSNKKSILLSMIALFIGISSSVMAGEFDGSWTLNDTNGKPFQATFSKDGTASGTHGDAMKHGTWKEENGAAVIHWNTGWISVIEKNGNKYIKKAYKPGTSMTDRPTNTSDAIKK